MRGYLGLSGWTLDANKHVLIREGQWETGHRWKGRQCDHRHRDRGEAAIEAKEARNRLPTTEAS